MQNSSAAHAALRTLRRFSESTAARRSCWPCRGGAFIRDEGFSVLQCTRAPLGLHRARFSSCTESDITSVGTSESNVFAEQGSASTTLKERNDKETCSLYESESTLNVEKSCTSSSPQLPMELCERLNRLQNMLEQSFALLTSQLEAQRQFLHSISDDIKCLKDGCKVQCPSNTEAPADIANLSRSGSTNQPAHPWPEWTHFIEKLKGLPFFKELVQVPEVAGFSFVDDSTTMKRMLAKFSQAYDYIFDALSKTHLQIVTDHESQSNDRRTVASLIRLKNHFQTDKKSDSCGVTSLELGNAKPNLSDVMRVIFTIAELAKKDGAPDNVKLSIVHLLEEIIQLTNINCKHGHVARSEAVLNLGSVLPNSQKEKSASVEETIHVQGSTSSCDAESWSRSYNWECSRCFHLNLNSKNECVECRYQRSVLNVDAEMPKSSWPAAKMIDMKVCVPGEEDKETSVVTPGRRTEMPILSNTRQDVTTEGFIERKSSSGVHEQQVLQNCILSENDLGSAGARDESDAEEQSDIFDDIFDQDDKISSRVEPKKGSLSDFIRQNKKAFSSTRREREQGIASNADDYEMKGMGATTDRGLKFDHKETNQRAMFDRFGQDDSDMDAEDKNVRQRMAGGGRAIPSPIFESKRNQSNNFAGSAEKGLTDRVYDDNRRRRTKSMQHYNREIDSDAESQTDNFVSRRSSGNKSKHCGDRDGYSDNDSGSRGRLERRRRESSLRSW